MAPFIFSGMLVAYSLFMGATIDMSNLWLHKYRATSAAQAACESGVADLVWVNNQGTAQAITNYEDAPTGFSLAVSTGSGSYANPPRGTSLSGSCSPSSRIAMCAYATADMPGAQGLNVSWAVSNVTPTPPTYNANRAGGVSSFMPPSNIPSTPPVTANGVLPYLHVTVSEAVPTYLLSVMPWFHTPVTVTASCDCGMTLGSGGEQTTQTVTIPAYELIGSFGEEFYYALATCTFQPQTQTTCNNYSGVATAPENSLGAPTAVPVKVTFSQTPGGGSTLATGSFTGTVSGQVSCDGGQTWQTVQSMNFTNTAPSGYILGATTCTVTDTNQIQVRAGVAASGSVPRNGGNFSEYIYWGFYAGSIQITTGAPAVFFASVFQGN